MINYKSVFQVLPCAFVIINAEEPYTILDANDEYCRITNRHKESILGMGLFEAFPPVLNNHGGDGVREVRDAIFNVIKTGHPHKSGITRYDIPISGTTEFETRYWNSDHIPVFGGDGKLQHIVQSAMDITQLINKGLQI